MRLKRYITELSFTKNIKVTPVEERGDAYRTHFIVDDINYLFGATLLRGSMASYSSDEWDIIFVPVDDSLKNTYMPDDKKMDAIKVFSAVAESLDMFIKKYKPKVFKFAPADFKLDSLYKIMAPKLAKKYPQYSYHEDMKGFGNHVFQLNESFTTKTNVKKISDNVNAVLYNFEVDGLTYQARFYKSGDITRPEQIEYEIMFGPEYDMDKDTRRFPGVGLQSTKDVLEIFSNVREAVKLFITEYHPTVFHFAPENAKLKPIYMRFAKELRKALPDYKYEYRDNREHLFWWQG